jgi:RimJ/RimL family protein N-acetyltransferase
MKKILSQIQLRPATLADAELLFQWRNDPLTRSNSFTTHRVVFDQHLKWLEASLQSLHRQIFVALGPGDIPIGTVRADFMDEQCELSWTVAPEHRQRGFGTLMVKEAIKRLRHRHFRARIKAGNVASERIARAAGLVLSETKWETPPFQRKAESGKAHRRAA